MLKLKLLFVMGFWLLGAVGSASACMCPGFEAESEKSAAAKQWLDSVDVVFNGVVTGSATEVRNYSSEGKQVPTRWTLYDIFVLEVGKGDPRGMVRIARERVRDDEEWLVGGYAEVVAQNMRGELQVGEDICHCNYGLLFGFRGVAPPWKAIALYTAFLLMVLGTAFGAYLLARRYFRRLR